MGNKFNNQKKKQKNTAQESSWKIVQPLCSEKEVKIIKSKHKWSYATKIKQKVYRCCSHQDCDHELRVHEVKASNKFCVEEKGEHSSEFVQSLHGIHVEMLEEVDSIINGTFIVLNFFPPYL